MKKGFLPLLLSVTLCQSAFAECDSRLNIPLTQMSVEDQQAIILIHRKAHTPVPKYVYQCLVDYRAGESPQQAHVENTPEPEYHPPNYAVPTIQEFFIPLQTSSTVIGAMFGSLRRQQNDINAYWEQRKNDLDNQNSQCVALSGEENIRSCLNGVRQSQAAQSQNILAANAQRVAQQQAQAAYMSSLLFGAAAQYGRAQAQMYQAPRYSYCNAYGNSWNCTSY